MGWGSDFLKTAFSMGAIPSKAWAIWTGSRSIDYPVDGSLVLGGYDSTRYVGQPTTFPSHSDCTTCVVVTGLTYDTATSSVSLFSNASETLQINLQPAQKVLYFTLDIFANFANATGGVWDPTLLNLVYPATTPPTGNLTVTLSNNYKTTISADDLFAYPRGFNTQGQYVVINDTVVLAEVQPQNNTGYVYDWGVPYLTMNYLMADYARNQFQMAPAIRTNFQSQGGGYELEAVCDPAVPVTTTPTTSAVPTATSTPTAAPIHHGGSNNTGAIVGGVVGGVLGLILIVGVLGFLFYRSRQRRRSPATTEAAGTAAQPPHDEKMSYGSAPAERYSQNTATSPTDVGELSSEKRGGNASVNEWLSSHGSEVSNCSVAQLVIKLNIICRLLRRGIWIGLSRCLRVHTPILSRHTMFSPTFDHHEICGLFGLFS